MLARAVVSYIAAVEDAYTSARRFEDHERVLYDAALRPQKRERSGGAGWAWLRLSDDHGGLREGRHDHVVVSN